LERVNTLVIDNLLNPFRETDYLNQFLFSGNLFECVQNCTIQPISFRSISIITNPNKLTHIVNREVILKTTAPLNVIVTNMLLFENRTVGVLGSSFYQISNLLRESNTTSKTKLYANSSFTAGDIRETASLYRDVKWKQLESELILKSDTAYSIRFFNSRATSVVASFNLSWYESDN
jgi:hypothetical protein